MQTKKRSQGHPRVWAALTLITFPVVLLTADALDVPGLWPFVYALLGTFLIFMLEALVRRRLWPFEMEFSTTFAHPETPYRILLLLGITLLILETVLIIGVATDRRFDDALVRLILHKQCDGYSGRDTQNAPEICQLLR